MNLGQVYTKASVAQYMVSLFTLPEGAKVLDPCFGKGVFLEALEKDARFLTEGIEIDNSSYTYYQGEASERCILHHGDFFSIASPDRYDGIIMNPPYVRQEDINDLSGIGICKDMLQNLTGKAIDSKANLYMYFLLYAGTLLKEGGELIAIFPNSWEKSRTGIKFREAMNSSCRIEQHITVYGNPFSEKPAVDVVIIKFKKTADDVDTLHKVISIEGDSISEEVVQRDREIEMDNAIPLSSYAQIRRGKTTRCNKVFINPDIKGSVALYDILSSPKDIDGFSTRYSRPDKYLFITDSNAVLEPEVRDYLSRKSDEIIKKRHPEALYKQIQENPLWYITSKEPVGEIVFPYIIRKSIRFILNERNLMVRDNFYMIVPRIDKFLMLALLNNSFIRYQLEKKGKTYGNHVLKVQKYDVDDLMIVNPEVIKKQDKDRLINAAKALAKTADEALIEEITSILATYYSVDNIQDLLNEIQKKRLAE